MSLPPTDHLTLSFLGQCGCQSFPFDMQVFPQKRSSKGGSANGPDSVVKRRTGVREETPLWENTASPARDVVETVVRTARRSTRPPPTAARPKVRILGQDLTSLLGVEGMKGEGIAWLTVILFRDDRGSRSSDL